MASSTQVAWAGLMADAADSVRAKRDRQVEVEEATARRLQEQLAGEQQDLARHYALSAALIKAVREAIASNGRSDREFFPTANGTVSVQDAIRSISREGERRYKGGVGFDALREAGMTYKPPGVR